MEAKEVALIDFIVAKLLKKFQLLRCFKNNLFLLTPEIYYVAILFVGHFEY